MRLFYINAFVTPTLDLTFVIKRPLKPIKLKTYGTD